MSYARNQRRRLKLQLLQDLDQNLATRHCGECTACCTVLTVAELDKPGGEPCPHAVQGCSIYDRRPKACRDYQCLWRAGIGSLEQRPDRIGIVFTPVDPGMPGHPGVRVHELWPGAFEECGPFLLEVAQRLVLLLIRDDLPKKVMGPEHLVLGMKAQIQEIYRLNAEARGQRLLGANSG